MIDRQRILVVEDDEGLRSLLQEELSDAGYATHAAADAETARAQIDTWRPHLVLSDLRLPAEDGLSMLTRERNRPGAPPFIMITAFGTIEQAVEALKRGAADFLTKPLDLDQLLHCVQQILGRPQPTCDGETTGRFHGMAGTSEAMRALFREVRRVGAAPGAALVIGESGTGKELVARALHAESRRAEGPFVAVNCAGVPPDLLESEFFGHVAGAFTGAHKSHDGLFAQADGGTLMLDEIGDMPLALQAKLLRTLQDGVVRPVGSARERQVDVRIVACTNRDLHARIADGSFREDLYYRLETFALRVPPLRERRADIPTLANHFLTMRDGAAPHLIDDRALALLQGYDFPGNVRELQNIIERAAAFCDEPVLGPAHLPQRVRRSVAEGNVGDTATPPEWMTRDAVLPSLAQMERRYIRFVLNRVDGNKRRAAALLGIGRRTLYRRLDEGDGA